MAYNLEISRRAEAEALEAVNYYDEIDDDLGDRFLYELSSVYRKIETNPEYYSYLSDKPSDNFRDIKMKSFPFVVIFEFDGQDVVVTSVMNTNRDHTF
jgi:mRNA-degrading endonuclease RelE of RelBE toxin-antitoxin system